MIEKLGSDRFELREEATRALMEREEAAAALQKALTSTDAEVRRRAADLLVALRPKRARHALARGRALGKEGRVVEMVDRLVYWKEWDTAGEGWEALTRFAGTLLECTAGDLGPPRPPDFQRIARFPAGDFRRYVEACHPREISSEEKFEIKLPGNILVRGETVNVGNINTEGLVCAIVASSEGVRNTHRPTAYSLVVTGGMLNWA